MGPRRGLPQNDRHRAIGMLEGRMTVNYVAVSFGVHRTTIWRLAQRFRITGTVKNRTISGRPKFLTPREERYIKITTGRDRFLPATRIVDRVRRATGVRISGQTVRNNLKACRFKSRRPHKDMDVHHKRQRHAWENQHMRRNCRKVLISDESRFTLKFSDSRIRVWRRPAERFAEACVMPVDHFGGGSLMVWGRMHYAGKTNLIVIRQTLNAHSATAMTFYSLL